MKDPSAKIISLVLRQTPFNTLRNAEALRMGLGLTLQDDHVQVIFVEDGVYILLKNKPEIIGSPGFARHLETLQQVGSSFIVEDESLQERGLLEPLPYPVQAKTRQEVALLLARSDIVIPY